MRAIVWAFVCLAGMCGGIAGALILFNAGVAADATGTSGASPWGWILLVVGAVLAFFGFVGLMQSLSRTRGRE